MITILLQCSLCWLFFMVIYHYFFRHETFFRFNRYYLLVTLGLGGVIPLGRAYWNTLFSDSIPQISFLQGSARVLEFSGATMPSAGFQWMVWLERIYWIGFFIAFALFIKELVVLIRWIHQYPRVYKKDYTLIHTDVDHLPFSFLNYVFISSKTQFISEEMEKIMQHEYSHVSGWHTADILLSRLIAVVAWPSPMVYWYQNTIRNTHEYLADAIVTKGSDTQSYGQLLIENSSRSLYMSLANHFIYSQLKNRINMMIKLPSQRIKAWKYVLIIPVLGLLAILFAYKSDNHTVQPVKLNIGSAMKDTVPDASLYILNNERVTKAEVANIYPNQITSVNILKGESAFKKYGPDGKGGVIEIQTRTLYLIDGVESTKEIMDKISPDDIDSKEVVRYGKNQLGVVSVKLKPKDSQTTFKKAIQQGVYTEVDEMPMFPGCEYETDLDARRKCANTKMGQYLYSNLKYPEQAKAAGLVGKVVIRFVVEKDGSISNASVLSDIGSGTGAEVLRVVNTMNTMSEKWVPGKLNGSSVPVSYTLPVMFRLPVDLKTNEQNKINPESTLPIKEIFKVVEEAPRFPGCETEATQEAKVQCANQKMLQYLYTNIQYPLEAKNSGIQGKVVVSFVVNDNGSISDAKILQDIGAGCGAEALRVIKSMNSLPEKWVPGRQKGQAVNVQYNIPVSFKLNNYNEKNIQPNTSVANTENSKAPIKVKAFDNLRISPNPANHQVEVVWPEKGEIHIHIFDMNGRVVHISDWGDFSGRQVIDVSKLAKGAYIIRAFNTKNSQDQKLLIQ